MPSKPVQKPQALQYNRKNSVLAERREGCARCTELEDRLERQIIQNGVLRLEILELKKEIRQIQASSACRW